MAEGRQYHIAMRPGDVGRYVLLPGDPGRCEQIAGHLCDARHVATNREYTAYTGYLDGERVSVMSTGIGGPSTAIGVEELVKIGANTFIRVGTCGGMQLAVEPGHIVIATGAIRAEGTSREILPVEFPAVADFSVARALVDAVPDGVTAHVGVVQCKDSFYGQHAPKRQPVYEALSFYWNAWLRGGCLASEMESAALFILASALRVRAGAVLFVAGNLERQRAGMTDPEAHDTAPAIETAIAGVKKLIAQRKEIEK